MNIEKGWRKGIGAARARNKLAEENSKLVHKVVHRMAVVCREPYEDLYQIGYVGLLKASERFNPATGNAFSSFAVPYIQGEIQHYLRDQWQAVKLPRNALEKRAKIRRLRKSLIALGREIEEIEIASGLGIGETEWRILSSLDSNVTISLEEILLEPSQELHEETEAEILYKCLNKLQPKHRSAIIESFFKGRCPEDIAKSHNASKQEIQAWIRLGVSRLKLLMVNECYE